MRKLKKTIAALGKLTLTLILCFLGFNLRDEDLNPEARKSMKVAAPAVADADNGYFILLGMDAPKGVDAAKAGLAIQATIDREYRDDPVRQTYSMPSAPPSEWKEWEKQRCPLKGTDCVAHYLANREGLTAASNSHQWLLERHGRLKSAPGFEERPLLSVNMPLPRYLPLIQASELQLARAVFLIDANEPAAGVSILAGEIILQRRLLASSRLLIGKMIGVAMLRRSYQVLSDTLEHWPMLTHSHAHLLAPILKPLSGAEIDMRRPFEGEVIFSAYTVLHLEGYSASVRHAALGGDDKSWIEQEGETWLLKCCYLPKATLNAVAPYWNKRAELGAGEASTADSRKKQLIAEEQAMLARLNEWPMKYLRNPVGKITTAMYSDDASRFFSYAERVYDLSGYIRAVLLQASLRREEVKVDNVANYVRQAPSDLRNPYNGEALRWDAATSSLVFEGRQPSQQANPSNEVNVHRIQMKFT